MDYAPIVLFVYNRPDHARRTLEALSANVFAAESHLFIFADGAKDAADAEQLAAVTETRRIIRSQQWCKKVEIQESAVNRGLAASIVAGVTEIVEKYGVVIVLEDDIVTGKYFLDFMNRALQKYQFQKNIWHITGWRNPVDNSVSAGSYLYPTMDCWGWATWSDRWQHFKKDALFYKGVFTPEMIRQFNVEGSDTGMWQQIEDNISGKINTWAIFWYATIFLQHGLCLAPTKSLVRNIGLDNSGVHCGTSKWQEITHLIDARIEEYPTEIVINRQEFEKNRLFLLRMHRPTLKQRVSRIIPKWIKKYIKGILGSQ